MECPILWINIHSLQVVEQSIPRWILLCNGRRTQYGWSGWKTNVTMTSWLPQVCCAYANLLAPIAALQILENIRNGCPNFETCICTKIKIKWTFTLLLQNSIFLTSCGDLKIKKSCLIVSCEHWLDVKTLNNHHHIELWIVIIVWASELPSLWSDPNGNHHVESSPIPSSRG